VSTLDPHTLDRVVSWLVATIALGPALAGALLGTLLLVGKSPSERNTARLVEWGSGLALLLSFALAGVWWAGGATPIPLHLGQLFEVRGYAYELGLLVDTLSLTMLLTTGLIVSFVARFSVHYLHRDPGYHRYFVLLCAFTVGMHLLVLAGSFDLLFVGWEIVGISSMLLIAFFRERPGPVRGATRAMVSYRVSDIGLLVAGILLHQLSGTSEFTDAFGTGRWPVDSTHLSEGAATVVLLVLLVSVVGKSAQFPLGGWLPRAMEGPTPSSALFYGALSVHAGVYLLLRAAPLLAISPVASTVVTIVGGVSAIWATASGRTRSDAKSAMAYATITQVGLMLVAIGLGFYRWALFHMVAHAVLRLWQLLRTPSALHDALRLRAAIAAEPVARPSWIALALSERTLAKLYARALHGFHVDEALDRFVVRPVITASRALDRFERRWEHRLAGRAADACAAPAEPEPLLSRPKADPTRTIEEQP
jgi:NADH-quinone oxidoreductase subunit L